MRKRHSRLYRRGWAWALTLALVLGLVPAPVAAPDPDPIALSEAPEQTHLISSRVNVTVSGAAEDKQTIDFAACVGEEGHDASDISHVTLETHGWQVNAGASSSFASLGLTERCLLAVTKNWADNGAQTLALDFDVRKSGYYNAALLVGSHLKGGATNTAIDGIPLAGYTNYGAYEQVTLKRHSGKSGKSLSGKGRTYPQADAYVTLPHHAVQVDSDSCGDHGGEFCAAKRRLRGVGAGRKSSG